MIQKTQTLPESATSISTSRNKRKKIQIFRVKANLIHLLLREKIMFAKLDSSRRLFEPFMPQLF